MNDDYLPMPSMVDFDAVTSDALQSAARSPGAIIREVIRRIAIATDSPRRSYAAGPARLAHPSAACGDVGCPTDRRELPRDRPRVRQPGPHDDHQRGSEGRGGAGEEGSGGGVNGRAHPHYQTGAA